MKKIYMTLLFLLMGSIWNTATASIVIPPVDIGTGNPNFTEFMGNSMSLLGKINIDEDGFSNGVFSIAFKCGDSNATEGTWSNATALVDYIQVNGGNGNPSWAIFKVAPAATNGKWYTDWGTGSLLNGGGKRPVLSNIKFYNVVPVPAAVWLLSSGLIGLLGIRRKA